MQCRICAANNAYEVGEVEYYAGFSWKIFDCPSCFCRFTKHDETIYNWLHSQPASIYALYREMAEKCASLFKQRDLDGLKRELFKASKYQFVIDAVEQRPRDSKLLEIGCARGCLASYFILAGYDAMGTDVSPDAIAGAREAFGNHFVLANSAAVEDAAPYDVIYHVGTIGCVGNPLNFTRDLLNMLKPGGQLFFNAPNADSCWLKGQLWIDSAPPPDVVTLFHPGFWRSQFSAVADVAEKVEMCSPDEAFGIGLRKFFRQHWKKPIALALDESANYYQTGRPRWNDRVRQFFELGILKIARTSGLLNAAASQPSPFGLFVKMTKK